MSLSTTPVITEENVRQHLSRLHEYRSSITQQIRKVHDFLTVGAATPLQHAAVAALNFSPGYYEWLAGHYTEARNRLLALLTEAGFTCSKQIGRAHV